MTLALTTGKRKIEDGSRFNIYFPPEKSAYGSETILKKSGNVDDTVKFIANIIEKDKADTAKIAKVLKGDTLKKTLANIHQFMIKYLQYDTEAGEKLRSPRRTWWVGQKQNDKQTGDNGVDCDDLAIFSGTILKNLGIPFLIRIVKINTDDYQHVYLIVPESGKGLSGPSYYTLDGVISEFNHEHPFKTEKTFDMHGIKIEYLGNIIDDTDNKVLEMLMNYRSEIASGQLLVTKINQKDLLKMLDYAIENWQDIKKRKKAVEILAASEKQNYPGQQFFAALQSYVFGELSGVLSGGLADEFSDNFTDLPKMDKTPKNWKPKKQGGGAWNAISSLFNAAAHFDWGIIGGKNKQNSTVPVVYNSAATPGSQEAGISITSIAGILMGGALLYFAYENFKKSKAKPKVIARANNHRKSQQLS